MADSIDRQAALDCFHDWIDSRGDVHTADEMPEYSAIEALPSAQPEIVRCKDCVHNKSAPTAGNATCTLYYGMTDQTGFCHMGERR